MQVTKRDGSVEELVFSKMTKVMEFACNKNSEHVLELQQELIPRLRHGMTTSEIQRTLIKIAVEKTSVERPFWQFIAAKLYVYDLYKEAKLNRGYQKFGYGDFYKLAKLLVKEGVMGKYMLKAYNRAEWKELGEYIKPERDDRFNYIGLYHLASRYMLRSKDKRVLELPQECFMNVAMHLAMNEPKDVRLKKAKAFYDVLSLLDISEATPTLMNARTPHPQLSSCFIDTVSDDLRGIYYTDSNFAQVSKHGGGMGIYIGKVRARGSEIRGVLGASGGIVPWIRNYNDTSVAVDQLGSRSGRVAIYTELHHRDIFDFLQLRTNNGDERMKAHDVFPAICVPDLFMKQVLSDGEWHLFCPHQIRMHMGWSLEDSYDEETDGTGEYTRRYWECVAHPLLPRKTVKAFDLMEAILRSCWETGTPFWFFRDTVNRANPNKHLGMIYSSNLCTEIFQNMSAAEFIDEYAKDSNGDDIIITKYKAGDFVVCNLASLNIGRLSLYEDFDGQLRHTIHTTINMLDNVIDLNFYPIQNARITNLKRRPVGMGLSGYHQMLAQLGIAWESQEHLDKADEVMQKILFYAIEASMELAKERGVYEGFEGSEWQTGMFFKRRGLQTEGNRWGLDWDWLAEKVRIHGIRNGWLLAIAPTGSSSVIVGSTASADPVFKKFFIEEKKGMVVPQTAPNLNTKTMWLYKEAHQIAQEWSVDAAGVRAKYIDQGQSFNLYVNPVEYSGEEGTIRFFNLFVRAWKAGLKSIYYVRNQSLEVEDCSSCSA